MRLAPQHFINGRRRLVVCAGRALAPSWMKPVLLGTDSHPAGVRRLLVGQLWWVRVAKLGANLRLRILIVIRDARYWCGTSPRQDPRAGSGDRRVARWPERWRGDQRRQDGRARGRFLGRSMLGPEWF